MSEALSKAGLDPMVPTMCELVYLSPIDSGQGWDDFADLGAVLAPWSGKTSDEFLPQVAAVRTSMTYPLPDEAGWLHVETNPARRLADGRPALMLQMRAVGAPFEKSLEGGRPALKSLDLGHEWIIRGFTSVTTPAMHQIWERET